MGNELLRVGETAKILNVSRWTIYRWVEEGLLESALLARGVCGFFAHRSRRSLSVGG